MRRVVRPSLAAKPTRYLAKRQTDIMLLMHERDVDSVREWKSSRQTKNMEQVAATLKKMMGNYERCIYCHDSHGSDIEHFWPKSTHPEKMFIWENLLLCCTECGRLKGNYFPILDGSPLLIDPSSEEPWHFLDFDPVLGVIVPAYDVEAHATSVKGEQTVRILQLDRREALQSVYLRTLRRLKLVVQAALSGDIPAGEIVDRLWQEDDHGLIGWFLIGFGRNVEPFSEMRIKQPEIWQKCHDTYIDL